MAMPQASVAFGAGLEVVRAVEPRIADAITDELDSQRHQLKLIASENYASPAVLLAMGNWLSDKYAEGTPGHRFYAGCEVVDRIETIANDRATALFGADHAYVQPHSGIDANLVGFWSILAASRTPTSRHTRRHSRERPHAGRLGGPAPRAGRPATDWHGLGCRRPSHP